MYWRAGDFVCHFAGIWGKERRLQLMKQALAASGSFPCVPPCAISDVARESRLPGEDKKKAGTFLPEGTEDDNMIYLLVVAADQRDAEEEAAAPIPHGVAEWMDHNTEDQSRSFLAPLRSGVKFYAGDGASISDDERDVVVYEPFEHGEGGQYRSKEEGSIVFPTAGGWGSLAIARAALEKWHIDDEDGRGNKWLVVLNIRNADAAANEYAAAARLTEGIHVQDGSGVVATDHLLLSANDCTGPWMIRNSEWGRTFLRRVEVGLLARRNRLEIKFEHWGHTSVGLEDQGGLASILCLFVKRDPTLALQVRFFLEHEG